jgi:hypothetical protein
VLTQGRALCRTEVPPLRQFGTDAPHLSACHFAEELAATQVAAGAGAEGGA